MKIFLGVFFFVFHVLVSVLDVFCAEKQSDSVVGYVCLHSNTNDAMVYTGRSGAEEFKKILGLDILPTEPSVRVWTKKDGDEDWHLGVHSLFIFKEINYEYLPLLPWSILEPFITQKEHSITFYAWGRKITLSDEKLTKNDSIQKKTVADTLCFASSVFQSRPKFYASDMEQFFKDKIIVQLPSGYYGRGKNGWQYHLDTLTYNIFTSGIDLILFTKLYKAGVLLRHHNFSYLCLTPQ